MHRSRSSGAEIGLYVGGALVVILVLLGCAWGYPQYRIYSQRSEGEATLQRAQYEKQVAELDAQNAIIKAKADAQAEVERAKGAAEANQVLANSLEGKEDYLRYLQIQALRETAGNGDRTVVYVPTDGLLPIMEAGRATQVQSTAPVTTTKDK